jgi:hypothetical protein
VHCQAAACATQDAKAVVRSLLQDVRTCWLERTEPRGHDEKTPFATCAVSG